MKLHQSNKKFGVADSEVIKVISKVFGTGLALNYVIQYEFAYDPYPKNMDHALDNALENRLYVLEQTTQKAVFQEIERGVVSC